MRGDFDPCTGAGKGLAAGAGDDQAVLALFQRGASGGERARHDRKAVRFLDAQFVEPTCRRHTLGNRGGDEQGGELVDHARRHGGVDFDALERGVAHMQVGNRLAANVAFVELLDLAAHCNEYVDKASARGIEAHVLDHDIAARRDERGNEEEGCRGGVARDLDGLGLEFRFAGEGDDARAVGLCFHLKLGAEALEHALGMVAGGDRLDDGGLAGRVEAGQQDRALHLR